MPARASPPGLRRSSWPPSTPCWRDAAGKPGPDPRCVRRVEGRCRTLYSHSELGVPGCSVHTHRPPHPRDHAGRSRDGHHQRDLGATQGSRAETLTCQKRLGPIPSRLPADSPQSADHVEVGVATHHGQTVLAAQGRYPRIIGGDRGAGLTTSPNPMRSRCGYTWSLPTA